MNYYEDFERIVESEEINWEQRRYEIAKDILSYCGETVREVLRTGHAPLGDKYKGMTIQEVIAEQAVIYADALIGELKKGEV